jgi:hypothetical protein
MALMTSQEITALETIQTQLKSNYASIRGVLNTLAGTPANITHNAYKALRSTLLNLNGAILDIENSVVSNDDDFS